MQAMGHAQQPPRVLIAGGGVAALEAALALRDLLGEAVTVELLAPEDELTLRPLAVGAAFGIEPPPPLSLAAITADLGASHRRDALASVDVEARSVGTRSGEEVGYEALLLAFGARAEEDLEGAITYRGGPDNDRISALLEEIERGEVTRVAFAVPDAVRWPLPIYELALLTAGRSREAGREAELVVVTHESGPLALFGARASESVAGLLSDAGVELVTGGRAIATDPLGLKLADGRVIEAERVVAAPRLRVQPIEGMPQDPRGFFDTDAQMRVPGADAVWAAGDATWFPIKQGGIAAQQADVAASSIAAGFDDSVEVEVFRPTLRGALFTGGDPHYLRAEVDRRALTSAAAGAPLWWPPSKIAGRHLAAYLAEEGDFPGPLRDLEPLEEEEAAGARGPDDDQLEAYELALTCADADANERDYRAALRWLDLAEGIRRTLPDEYVEKRRRWSETAGPPPG